MCIVVYSIQHKCAQFSKRAWDFDPSRFLYSRGEVPRTEGSSRSSRSQDVLPRDVLLCHMRELAAPVGAKQRNPTPSNPPQLVMDRTTLSRADSAGFPSAPTESVIAVGACPFFHPILSYLLSPISYLLSPILSSILSYPISYILYPISYILYPISYPILSYPTDWRQVGRWGGRRLGGRVPEAVAIYYV